MSTSGTEVLEKRAVDELDLAIGRLVAAIVATLCGITVLVLSRTQVSFVLGVITLLAGLGWFAAVRRASRAVKAQIVFRLELDDTAIALTEATTARIPWDEVTEVAIDDDAAGIEVRSATTTLTIAPGFGDLALVPLYEKILARWAATRGDARP
jgi:hypothetical protein